MRQSTTNEYEWKHPYLWHVPTKSAYHLIDGEPLAADAKWYSGVERTTAGPVSAEYDMEAVREMAGDLLKKRA